MGIAPGEHHPHQGACPSALAGGVGERDAHELGIREPLVEARTAKLVAGVLVEEVLELQRRGSLARVGGVQCRVGEATLQ